MPVKLTDKTCVSLDTDKIEKLRIALGMTQTQAAKKMGLPGVARWNDIESGRRSNVSIKTLERIASVLGVKAKDLLK